MVLVTGGAGFIGSHIVRALNERGRDDVMVVDDLTEGGKCVNLADCTIADYLDVADFRARLRGEGGSLPALSAILHQGACADTTESDGRTMMDNNFTCSKELLAHALARGVPFVYASSASVYGANRDARVDPSCERPLNVYAYSKLAFDQYVRRALPGAESLVAGLRYFNVYGAREAHKGRMASMVSQLYDQLRDTGVARIFAGADGCGDGEQKRDFVHVSDVVNVNLFFADGRGPSGIYNVGTGRACSFNDLCAALIAKRGRGRVEHIPFPDALKGKYQDFTQADLTGLRDAGYTDEFLAVPEGIDATFE